MADDREQVIGFVGTGTMGSAMALRLVGIGRQVVVHNRTRDRALAVEQSGAAWAGSPRELALGCDVVLGCLRDSHAVEEVYLGPNGLLAHARPGQLFVEHATFRPQLAREVAAAAQARGAAFLDAPVTGGPTGARLGRLVIMAGEPAEALEAVASVLAAYAILVERVGPVGSGLELKLVNQLLVSVHMQLLVSVHMAVAGEAMAVLSALDLDPRISARVLAGGWAGSAMLARAFAQLEAGDVTGTGATVAAMAEIQELVGQLADGTATHTPLFDAARTRFDLAVASGLAEHDPAALVRIWTRDRQ